VDPFRKDAALRKPSSHSFVHNSNPCPEGLAAFRLHSRASCSIVSIE